MADLRIGRVSDVNESNCAVRVRFESEDMTSGWLKVLQTPHQILINGSVSPCTVTLPNSEDTVSADVGAWMPTVGETVLCVYGGEWNSDGYVLGAVK